MWSTTHHITFFLEDKKETMLSGYFFGYLRLTHDYLIIHQPYSAVFDNCKNLLDYNLKNPRYTHLSLHNNLRLKLSKRGIPKRMPEFWSFPLENCSIWIITNAWKSRPVKNVCKLRTVIIVCIYLRFLTLNLPITILELPPPRLKYSFNFLSIYLENQTLKFIINRMCETMGRKLDVCALRSQLYMDAKRRRTVYIKVDQRKEKTSKNIYTGTSKKIFFT